MFVPIDPTARASTTTKIDFFIKRSSVDQTTQSSVKKDVCTHQAKCQSCHCLVRAL